MDKIEKDLNNFLIYKSPSGDVKVEIFFQNENIWLSKKKMGLLFGKDSDTIGFHLKNIYSSGELEENSTTEVFSVVQNEGTRQVNRNIVFYNLDAIISVGYRVNSSKATQFRIWATKTLKEFIIKGFVLDDDRMKNGKFFGKDYFKELLERVRSIRSSERRIYQQITDIFAECSIDYDPSSDITRKFFSMVQNKFHFAISGNTAAEIIMLSADSKEPNMGLSTWKNAPNGRILKSDAKIAKNYLKEPEIKRLERTISGYFDYIENLIENRTEMTMKDLALSVDKFLHFNEYKVLRSKGRVSKKKADNKAANEYDKFNKNQNIESDFDKSVKGLREAQKNIGNPKPLSDFDNKLKKALNFNPKEK